MLESNALPEAQTMTDPATTNDALGPLLEGWLSSWEQSFKPQEEKMLECYQDVMRIPRDGDTKGTGAAKTNQEKALFVGSTRNKVRATRAKIVDALFGNGKMPFDTSPVKDDLQKFSDCMETILTEQMERMDLRTMLKDGVDTLATYGTGFIFGPFVRQEKHIETMADNSLGYTQIKEQEYPYDAPYYLLGNSLDCIPDPEARNMADGAGIFWRTWESKHTVRAWMDDKSYSNIDMALLGSEGNEDAGSDRAKQMRANSTNWHKDGRVKVARFFGKVPARMLPIDGEMVADTAIPEEETIAGDPGEMVDAIIVMAGGHIVKANRAPYSEDCDPVLVCQYERVPHELWGVGVADNNSPHQKVVNAAFRLFMNGKAMALMGTKSVDRSKFMPGEDFKKTPGKVWQMKPGLSPEERQTAIITHVEPDVSNGWRDVIQMSEQMSDDDTALTKYTQGDDSRNLNKTASGISMIMQAGSLPSKEVLQNIDGQWIVKIVKGLVDWNLKYLEPETVAKIHGDEMAQVWTQIKQFGKSSFMEWKATGTSSFMAKEVLLNKVRAFLDLALSNPLLAEKVDISELLEQYWDCMEMGRESPIIKQDGQKIPPQVEAELKQTKEHAQQMEKALSDLGDKYNELHAKSDEAAEERRIKAYQAQTARLAVVADKMTPQMVAQVCDELGLDLANDPELVPAAQQIEQQMQEQNEPDEPQQPEAQEPDAVQQDAPMDAPASAGQAPEPMPDEPAPEQGQMP
jgi:hypothetical protein